ncbi:MAG: hypothetical protein K0S74_1475 [Chlamydiales bacterium]|jgi:hypothetical protein|nr:hypothetical protein [Chlamydiales bacterium]
MNPIQFSELSLYIINEPLDQLKQQITTLSPMDEEELPLLFKELQEDLSLFKTDPAVLLKLFQSLSIEQLSSNAGCNFLEIVRSKKIFHHCLKKNFESLLKVCERSLEKEEVQLTRFLFPLTRLDKFSQRVFIAHQLLKNNLIRKKIIQRRQ